MPELFNSEEVDLSSLYRDSAAPKDPDPSELLFGQLGAALKAAGQPRTSGTKGPLGSISPVRPSNPNPIQGRDARPPVTRPTPGAGNGRPGGPSGDSMNVLARLKPMGITNLNSLRGKSDIELRKLSKDVVQYELRQQSLTRFFKQNPDGSWDFTVGPDGAPTGLDANGRVIPPGGATTAPATTAPAQKPPVRPQPTSTPTTGTVTSPTRPTGSAPVARPRV